MATAVEMTIALGRTLYGAPDLHAERDETENSETIEGCETRVSVTWRLTEGEQNLPLTASLLAEKTVQVLETADRTVRCKGEKKEEKPADIEQVPVQSQSPVMVTPASVAPPTNGAASTSVMARGNSTAACSYAASYVPRITKPQSLAIQSLCTRHGIADWELRRLVWEQFGKKEQSELTKEQAAELLTLLQQNTAGDAQGHAYAS